MGSQAQQHFLFFNCLEFWGDLGSFGEATPTLVSTSESGEAVTQEIVMFIQEEFGLKEAKKLFYIVAFPILVSFLLCPVTYCSLVTRVLSPSQGLMIQIFSMPSPYSFSLRLCIASHMIYRSLLKY